MYFLFFVFFQYKLIFLIGPIEQNVQSTRVRGAYELILIDQMSRSLERF